MTGWHILGCIATIWHLFAPWGRNKITTLFRRWHFEIQFFWTSHWKGRIDNKPTLCHWMSWLHYGIDSLYEPMMGWIADAWASCQIRKITGCACTGNAGNVFPRGRLQRKLLVSDPDMHHGTCVTHVPWCMLGSLNRGGGENVPGIPGACETHNITYLARGPCMHTPSRWVDEILRHPFLIGLVENQLLLVSTIYF